MRRILTALVATAAIAGFAGSALAGAGCGSGYHSASKVGSEIATTGSQTATGQTGTDQTTKPVQQTQAPTGSSQ